MLLVIGLLSILGCATPPEQPAPSEPYALLSFPTTVQLLALDTQQFDTRFPVQTLRVRPGQHTLRLVYVATGADSSATHSGQPAAPFTLDVQAGMTYHFVAKT
jgi:hypothetical protein